MTTVIPGFRAIIPAGGAGTRLWPLSRRSEPKFLRDFTGSGRTLIQATWDRLMPLTGPDGIVVVTGQAHGAAIVHQLPGGVEILIEPSPRDSMAAIGLAAAVLEQREAGVIVGSFAADHAISGRSEFGAAVGGAVEAAREGYVATIGIAPTGPSTAYGYIHLGEPLVGLGARRVAAFVEKPSASVAAEYLATGEYRWNAGMFVARADVLLDSLARYRPALHQGLRTIAAAWDTPDRARILDEQWPALEKVAIDHAIAEPLAADGGVAVIPAGFAWDDVGDWDSVARLLPAGDDDVRRLGEVGRVLAVDAPGATVVSTTGRAVAVVGVEDAVVVDMGDVVLVTRRDAAQQVRDLPSALAAEGDLSLL
ncbi:MAG: mannose-1-phosphate guanylyltransferase [Micrococcales bacterium]|nr:mannose-1-phosphate guanylyltransferase [Micrococcales bacterium]